MLYGIALMYILLCIRFQVRLEASFEDGQGGSVFCVGAWGIYMKREFVLVRGENACIVWFVPRGSIKKWKKNPASAFVSRFLRNYMLDSLRRGRFERLEVCLRLGLGDACETAVAAGAVRAMLCSLLASSGSLRVCELRIVPEFSCACLRAHLRGIFSCQLGDIMLAALKTALRKRKEGLKWTNIPLRA